ncbi:MAG TPA: DUF2334 domain-containing protein [Terracidiphilus sp.]
MRGARVCKPAQYLLRVDDLCPTVHRERWERLRALIEEFGLRPILAVVPANEDRELDASPADQTFWRQMRALQGAGAAIALHGFSHTCSASGRSLVPVHRTSEFAGISFERQRERIACGMAILRGHGLDARLFVAPRHGFDNNTLRALQEEGIGLLSDGFTRVPFVRGGLTWIPMQLWAPVPRSSGVWTICVHPNTLHDAQIAELRTFLRSCAGQFTSVDRVLAEFDDAPLSLRERVYALAAITRLRMRRSLSRRRRQAEY